MPKCGPCVFPGCGRRRSSYPELVYFRFPVCNMERSLKWIEACQRPDLLAHHYLRSTKLRQYHVCQRHFHHAAFTNVLHRRLIHSAVPTLDGFTHTDQTTMPQESAPLMECREPCLPSEEIPEYIVEEILGDNNPEDISEEVYIPEDIPEDISDDGNARETGSLGSTRLDSGTQDSQVDTKPQDRSPNITGTILSQKRNQFHFEDCFDAADMFFGCPIDELSVKRPLLDPSKHPLQDPSKHPLQDPSKRSLQDPSKRSLLDPSKRLLLDPSKRLLLDPSKHLLLDPSKCPLLDPSKRSLLDPSKRPVLNPSKCPLLDPSKRPLLDPPKGPLQDSSKRLLLDPSKHPLLDPSKRPVLNPSKCPLLDPSKRPLLNPRKGPLQDSSKRLLLDPSKHPLLDPSKRPVLNPPKGPLLDSSKGPLLDPSKRCVLDPSKRPLLDPSKCILQDASKHPLLDPSKYLLQDPSVQHLKPDPSLEVRSTSRGRLSPTKLELIKELIATKRQLAVATERLLSLESTNAELRRKLEGGGGVK